MPRRGRFLANFRLTDEVWESLSLPINLAFFLQSTPAGRVVALYPSPAGATESLVTLEAWESLMAENPVLREFEPDVEALLVNRVGPGRILPRRHRRVLQAGRPHSHPLARPVAGTAVWDEINRFFAGLKERTS